MRKRASPSSIFHLPSPQKGSPMNRAEAWDILSEHTKTEPLRKHALAVEAAMKAYARKLGGDEEKWGIVGLLHDFDFEMYPTAPDHPLKGAEILRRRGAPHEIIHAVLCHAPYTGAEPTGNMDLAIY